MSQCVVGTSGVAGDTFNEVALSLSPYSIFVLASQTSNSFYCVPEEITIITENHILLQI